jgi:hypothetical protein
MKRIELTPSVKFGLSQAIGAPIAVYFQSLEMQGFNGTEGVTVSVFCCLFVFDIFNAVQSLRIWSPTWEDWRDTPKEKARKESRNGFFFYSISAVAYSILTASCLYSRIYVEYVYPFQPQDFQTGEIVIGLAIALYAATRMSNVRDPFNNPYFCGILGFIVVLVPQVASGAHILRAGSKGVSEYSLWIGLGLIFCKLIYYRYVHKHGEDDHERARAKGVLIAESGNLTSWLYVLRSFYTTLH